MTEIYFSWRRPTFCVLFFCHTHFHPRNFSISRPLFSNFIHGLPVPHHKGFPPYYAYLDYLIVNTRMHLQSSLQPQGTGALVDTTIRRCPALYHVMVFKLVRRRGKNTLPKSYQVFSCT